MKNVIFKRSGTLSLIGIVGIALTLYASPFNSTNQEVFDAWEAAKKIADDKKLKAVADCEILRNESLAKNQNAYEEGIENCNINYDEAEGNANDQLEVDSALCRNDHECLRRVGAKYVSAIDRAGRAFDACEAKAGTAKNRADKDAQAAHNRCVGLAESARRQKELIADYAHIKCIKKAEKEYVDGTNVNGGGNSGGGNSGGDDNVNRRYH